MVLVVRATYQPSHYQTFVLFSSLSMKENAIHRPTRSIKKHCSDLYLPSTYGQVFLSYCVFSWFLFSPRSRMLPFQYRVAPLKSQNNTLLFNIKPPHPEFKPLQSSPVTWSPHLHLLSKEVSESHSVLLPLCIRSYLLCSQYPG